AGRAAARAAQGRVADPRVARVRAGAGVPPLADIAMAQVPFVGLVAVAEQDARGPLTADATVRADGRAAANIRGKDLRPPADVARAFEARERGHHGIVVDHDRAAGGVGHDEGID